MSFRTAPARSLPDSALRVLVVGGGVAGLEAILALRDLAAEHVDLTLLAPDPDFVYRPLEVLAPFDPAAVIRVPWSEIAADLGVRHIQDSLVAVQPQTRSVRTASGRVAWYEALVVALGASPRVAVPGALTLTLPGTSERVAALLAGLVSGDTLEMTLVAPLGVAWTLPIYELALLVAAHVRKARATARLAVITAELEPLEVLGSATSTLVRRLLAEQDIRLRTGSVADSYEGGQLWLELEGSVAAPGVVVALPRLEGPHIPGLRATGEGFLPVDGDGRVQGEDAIYAAGDATSFPIKQGGLATQQADAAAAHIALRAGVRVARDAFDPALHALMITGGAPHFLRRGRLAEPERTAVAGEPLRWPPNKIIGRHLSPYLAERVPEARNALVPLQPAAHR